MPRGSTARPRGPSPAGRPLYIQQAPPGDPPGGLASPVEGGRWLLEKINDFEFESVESFQNGDGSRVASRWRVTGRNNGVLGTAADQRPISLTGTAVWAVREDGKLLHNWVERSSWELYQRLKAD